MKRKQKKLRSAKLGNAEGEEHQPKDRDAV
jgi:hypothetical protein